MRRILGILVMIAGILGLVLSLAGLVSVWMVKPTLAGYAETTITTLNDTVSTSQKAMLITGQALGATIDSVNALSDMLGTTAESVENTKPILDQVNNLMSDTLPATFTSASDSLRTAQSAAQVLDNAIQSLDSFRSVLSVVPIIGSYVEKPKEAYKPEKPLADSLGELVTNLESLPETFTKMSANLDNADNNFESIASNLTTMSTSVKLISQSLSDYQSMIGQTQSSMENLKSMLTNFQNNLNTILNGIAIVFTLFFLWLLAAQVVILSQGWELYQGTAGRMEGGTSQQPVTETQPVEPTVEA